MPTEYLTIDPAAPRDERLMRVGRAIAEGALVVLPTDTLYGVVASAARDDSIERLRAFSPGSQSGALSVHIAHRDEIQAYAPDPSALTRRLIRKGWPGPLTLVIPKADAQAAPIQARLSPAGMNAIYGDGAISIRWPDHPVSDAVIAASGVPIVAVAADVAEHAATAEDLRDRLENRVDIIVDAGPTRFRKISTIVRVDGQGYNVLRAGVYDERTVKRLATTTILFVCSGNTCRSPMAEGFFKKMLADRLQCGIDDLPGLGFVVRSAGTFAGFGAPANPLTLEVLQRSGIDLAGHHSRGLGAEDINMADFIYTMSRGHLETVLAIAPDAASKTQALDPDAEIADPIGGPISAYEDVAVQIRRALERRIEEVTA